jgi:hypothetical protein
MCYTSTSLLLVLFPHSDVQRVSLSRTSLPPQGPMLTPFTTYECSPIPWIVAINLQAAKDVNLVRFHSSFWYPACPRPCLEVPSTFLQKIPGCVGVSRDSMRCRHYNYITRVCLIDIMGDLGGQHRYSPWIPVAMTSPS